MRWQDSKQNAAKSETAWTNLTQPLDKFDLKFSIEESQADRSRETQESSYLSNR